MNLESVVLGEQDRGRRTRSVGCTPVADPQRREAGGRCGPGVGKRWAWRVVLAARPPQCTYCPRTVHLAVKDGRPYAVFSHSTCTSSERLTFLTSGVDSLTSFPLLYVVKTSVAPSRGWGPGPQTEVHLLPRAQTPVLGCRSLRRRPKPLPAGQPVRL